MLNRKISLYIILTLCLGIFSCERDNGESIYVPPILDSDFQDLELSANTFFMDTAMTGSQSTNEAGNTIYTSSFSIGEATLTHVYEDVGAPSKAQLQQFTYSNRVTFDENAPLDSEFGYNTFKNSMVTPANMDGENIYGIGYIDPTVNKLRIDLDNVYRAWNVSVSNVGTTILSIENGDEVLGAKAFEEGDFFLLKVEGILNEEIVGSVEVPLADYRASIFEPYRMPLQSWDNVDLSIFNEIDALQFSFISSDTTAEGVINTPTYFAFDNLDVLELEGE